MRSQTNLAENVIVIEPGSYFLRIGRASDASPKCLPHCIARKPKNNIKPTVEQVIPRKKPILSSNNFTKSLEDVNSDIYKLFKIKMRINSLNEHNLNGEYVDTQNSKDALLFELETNTTKQTEYYALSEAFDEGLRSGYIIRWPLRYGHFSTLANYTSVLQDLEDIWLVALERYVGVSRSSFSSYRVVLVITDVYKRSELRHFASLLFDRFKFSRVFIHQASVCSTYGMGIPTACVINLGDQKTSVCCVEDGISHADTRVTLPVGRSDVIRVFHSLVLPNGLNNVNGLNGDFSYKNLSDVEDLRNFFENANEACVHVLQNTTHEEAKQIFDEISTCFSWNSRKFQFPSVSLSISSVLMANFLPFSNIKLMSEDDLIPQSCTYQSPSVNSSEPDDPFDDLYVSLTARERKKRGAGPFTATGERTNLTEIEQESADAVISVGSNPPKQQSKFIDSLPEAVWWSISQCAKLVASRLTADLPQAAACIPGASEDVSRRLLTSIVLVGGGASGASNQLLDRWLTEQLTQYVRDKFPLSTQNYQVVAEIITQNETSDLTWIGARLVLTTDLLNDLWLTQSDWKRLGSRLLREKVPFLW